MCLANKERGEILIKANLPFCPKDIIKLLIVKQSHDFKLFTSQKIKPEQ